MKRIFHIIVIVIVAVMFFSDCQDVLEKKPLNIISDSDVWDDQMLIDAYLTQQYVFTPVFIQDTPSLTTSEWGVVSPVSPSGDWGSDMGITAQFFGPHLINAMSDEGLMGWGQAYSNFKLYGIGISGGCSEYFELPYKVIRNLNDFIARVPNSPVDPSFARLRIAEARFLRAFHYFAMVKRYGGVPLVTKVQQLDDSDESLYPVRNSEKELYDFIISEMDAIAEDLQATVEFGRPTKEAALAFKCRAALYAGSIAQFGTVQLNGLLGIPSSEANSYYQKAYDAANEIINSGKHALYNRDADKVLNFKNVFLVKRNPEVILAVQHDNVPYYSGGHGWSWQWCNTPQPHSWGCGNSICPYLETVEEYEYIDGRSRQLDREAIQQGLWELDDIFGGKDPRFYATIYMQDTPWKPGPTGKVEFYQGIIVNGELIDAYESGYEDLPSWGNQRNTAYDYTGFGVMKLLDENANIPDFAFDATDYAVFRYAEILLNFAEAAFELGKPSEALSAVNQIRSRAGIPELATISRELIRHERRVELAYEGHRYWDIIRWRVAESVLSGYFSSIKYILDYESTKTETLKYQLMVIENVHGIPCNFPSRNYYFPITLGRTANNPNLVENPGYQ